MKKTAEELAEEQKQLEVVADAVTEKVVARLKESKPLRKDIFGGKEDDTTKDLASQKKDAAEFMKRLVLGQETKALSAGTSTSGSELVPTYVSDSIITVAQKYGLVRKYSTKWPMQGINENVPTMSTVTAYRLARDTSPITASQPTTGTVQLRAKTVGVIVPVSKVLLQNSNPNVVDAITTLAGKAIAKLEDQWGILGLAGGEGVFQNTSVPVAHLGSGDTTYAKVQAEDLLNMLDLIYENFVGDKMRWAMSLSVLNAFRKLRSVVGSDKQGFLFQGFGASVPSTMWDLPYDFTAIMPKTTETAGDQAGKKFLALIDYDNMIFGDAMQYTMEISDQATVTDVDGMTLINLFQQNMVAIKIWGLIDIQLANPSKAFCSLATAAS